MAITNSRPGSASEGAPPGGFAWTICPGCVERQDAGDTEPCNVCGRVNRLRNPVRKHSIWTKFRDWMLRPLGTVMQLGTLVAWLPMLYILATDWGDEGAILCTALFWTPLCATWTCRFFFRVVFLFPDFQRRYRRPGWRGFALLPLGLAGIYLATTTLAVPRVLFLICRTRLIAIVKDQARAGYQKNLHVWPYAVLKVERNQGEVRIIVTQTNQPWSTTYAGFAIRAMPVPDYSNYGMHPEYTPLSGEWYWVKETMPH